MPPSLQDRIRARFPDVVLERAGDLDPGVGGEVLDAFFVPDDRVDEFRRFVADLQAARSPDTEPLVVLPHTASWTRANRPDLQPGAPG